jgi:DNA polymerase-1
MPEIMELHTSQEFVERWVKYGLLDAEITFMLFHALKPMMKELPVQKYGMENTWDLYERYWLPFGSILTDMERKGIFVSRDHLVVW